MHCQHLCQKHVMGAQFQLSGHTALQIDGALRHHGRLHVLSLKRRQLHCTPFIHIPAAFDPAVVCSAGQRLRGQIHDKLPRLLYHMIGITLRSDRDRNHGRIRTDRTRPCHGKEIGITLPVRHADQNRRQGIEHIARFPYLSAHNCLRYLCIFYSFAFLLRSPAPAGHIRRI